MKSAKPSAGVNRGKIAIFGPENKWHQQTSSVQILKILNPLAPSLYGIPWYIPLLVPTQSFSKHYIWFYNLLHLDRFLIRDYQQNGDNFLLTFKKTLNTTAVNSN